MARDKQESRPITGGRVEKTGTMRKFAVDGVGLKNQLKVAVEIINESYNNIDEYVKVPEDLIKKNEKLSEENETLITENQKLVTEIQNLVAKNKILSEENKHTNEFWDEAFEAKERAEEEKESQLRKYEALLHEKNCRVEKLKTALKAKQERANEYARALEVVKKAVDPVDTTNV